METLPLSEVKARLSEIAEEVDRTHQRVNITRNGRDYVVLMSAADLESLEATLELLSDPEALARLAQAQADLAAGHQITGDQMAPVMEQRRHRERPSA
jgi:prevent-host-death family protein